MITYEVPENFSPLFIKEGSSLTFSDCFRLGYTTRAVAEFHGYIYRPEFLLLPQARVESTVIESIRQHIVHVLPLLETQNEVAKREFMIAPIVSEIAIATKARISTDVEIDISESLRGRLDYLLESAERSVIVVEAKRDNLDDGFSQLVAELIAIDQWTDSQQAHVFGAVSVGKAWSFGILERESKIIYHDLETYSVPLNLEKVMRILTAALLPSNVAD